MMISTWDWAIVVASLVAWWLVAQFVKGGFQSSRRRKYKLPPGPPTWPVVGNLHLLMTSKKPPHCTVADLAQKYGPVMRLKLGGMSVVYVTDPTIAEECFRNNDKIFASRPKQIAAAKYVNYGRDHTSLAPYGDYWRFVKKLGWTELLCPKSVAKFEPVRTAEVDEVIRIAYEASVNGAAMNLQDAITKLGLRSLCRTIATRGSVSDPADEDKFVQALQSMVHLYGQGMMEDYIPALSWMDRGLRAQMRASFKQIDLYLQMILDEHKRRLEALTTEERAEYRAEDMLDFVLLNDEARTYLGERNIKALCLDMIGAGSETSSVALEWAMAEVIANPHVLKKAQQEVDAVVGKERSVVESDVPNLPYLQAVLKESMRLHPSLPWLLPRENSEDCQLAGYDIPANTTLLFQIWAMGRHSGVWEDAHKFDPERFVGSPLDLKGNNKELMPFGAGRRYCSGATLALALLHVSLARLIHSFDWQLPPGVLKLDMSESFGLTLPMKTPLSAVPVARLAATVYPV